MAGASDKLPALDGRPPDAEKEKAAERERVYILSKISECRKTCEWIAGLGIAYVLSALLRSKELSAGVRHISIPLAFVQILVAVFGAWPVTSEVNVESVNDILRARFRRRRHARFVSMCLLLVGLGVLSVGAWS